MRLRVRSMRQAMAPRLAIRTFLNMHTLVSSSVVSFPDEDLDGGGVVGVAGIVELRAVGDDDEGVHLGAELDVFACVGDAVGEGELAGGGDRDVHEEVDVGGEVALVERGPSVRDQSIAPLRKVWRQACMERFSMA